MVKLDAIVSRLPRVQVYKKHKPNCEYYINLKDIQIIPQYLAKQPNFNKMTSKWDFYYKHGRFKEPIMLMDNLTLVDGYTSYLIAKTSKLTKVPVYFIN